MHFHLFGVTQAKDNVHVYTLNVTMPFPHAAFSAVSALGWTHTMLNTHLKMCATAPSCSSTTGYRDS